MLSSVHRKLVGQVQGNLLDTTFNAKLFADSLKNVTKKDFHIATESPSVSGKASNCECDTTTQSFDGDAVFKLKIRKSIFM